MNKKERDELILKHYRAEVALHGASMYLTMPDKIIRHRELEALDVFLSVLHKRQGRRGKKKLRILDLGCGNGYTLTVFSKKFPHSSFVGLDFSPEMLAEARKQKMKGVELLEGDARNLNLFSAGSFDAAYTVRCLINILTWQEQRSALLEIHRVVRPGGYCCMIEMFTDGLESSNRARAELGLEPITPTYHNKHIDRSLFLKAIQDKFTVVPPEAIVAPKNARALQPNFLSSYYFFSRVIYPALTKTDAQYNTEFVKFFSQLAPVGNYAPFQVYILEKLH